MPGMGATVVSVLGSAGWEPQWLVRGSAGVGATVVSALGVFPVTELYPECLHLNRRGGLRTLP